MSKLAGPEAKKIKNLFGGIANTYDRANDVITFGMARRWRKKLVKWSGAQPGMSVLDCATGTGDLALNFKSVVGKTGHVVGSDFCPEMIALAPDKAKKQNTEVTFQIEDVTELSPKDNSFDITSIAYGIRNVQDPKKGLSEMARVTKPGGKVMVIETGEITTPIFKHLIPIYFNFIVPLLGGFVSGNKEAYDYLNKSSSQFPCKEEFVEIMKSTEMFSEIEYISIMGGASYIYKGTVKSLT